MTRLFTWGIIQLSVLILTDSILLRGHMDGIITRSVKTDIIILMELPEILPKKIAQRNDLKILRVGYV